MALINCQECGKEISDRAAACPHCGCPLIDQPTSDDLPGPLEGGQIGLAGEEGGGTVFYSKDYFYQAFVGEIKAAYYIRIFSKMNENGSVFSWNWAAFFFNSIWLLYRKLYAVCLVYVVVTSAVAIAATRFVDSQPQSWLIVMNIFFASVANGLYKNKADKKVKESEALFAGDEKKVVFLKEKGGVSYTAMLLGIALYIVIVLSSSILEKM